MAIKDSNNTVSSSANEHSNKQNKEIETDLKTNLKEQSNTSQNLDNSHSETNLDYFIKWVLWKSENVAIITQNRNGPCPLLAILNLLLLTKRIRLPSGLQTISSKRLIDHIGVLMLEDMPTDLTETEKLNYEKNISDAIAVFPKLLTGIDVNVKFQNVSSFEFTSELAVFDLLNIRLYHGWVPDPQDATTHKLICNCSYNQLIDKIIRSKESTNENLLREGLIVEEFLNSSMSQITYHGVVSLLESLNNHEISILFRNNHFLTLCKNENELFTLVTDQGFLNKPRIVWESLSSVSGDTHFTDSDFRSPNFCYEEENSSFEPTNKQQLENDLQMALSLQKSESSIAHDFQSTSTTKPLQKLDNKETENSDHNLAKKLQQQFDNEVQLQPTQQKVQRSPKNDKCNIL